MTPPASNQLPGAPRPHADCTTSYLLPILDSAAAAYELAGVAYVSTLDESRFRKYPISKQGDMAVGGVFAAAFVGSAIYGYVSASRCRRIQRGPEPSEYVPGYSRLESRPRSLAPRLE